MAGSFERHSTAIVPHQELFPRAAPWCNLHVATRRQMHRPSDRREADADRPQRSNRMIEASTGNSLPLDPRILASYRHRMRGELYTPDAVTKEQPALVARCLCAYDVALAIALARALLLVFAVHSGGYSQAGRHVSTGCLLIDLSQLRQITLDPLQRIVRVEPGATNDELARAAAAHGLATTGASASVGMDGSTHN